MYDGKVVVIFTFENLEQNSPNWCCHEACVANLQYLLCRESGVIRYLVLVAFLVGVARFNNNVTRIASSSIGLVPWLEVEHLRS